MGVQNIHGLSMNQTPNSRALFKVTILAVNVSIVRGAPTKSTPNLQDCQLLGT